MRTSTFFLIAAVIAFASCKKSEEETAAPGTSSGNATGSVTPSFVGADAILLASRVHTTQTTVLGQIDIIAGIATGAFTVDAFSNLLDVGGVHCNTEALTRESNNAYVYTPTTSNPTGIDVTASNDIMWQVAGGGGFSAFDRNITGPFAAVDAINSSTTVVRANGYTLSTSAMLNADSVVFAIGPVVRTLPGNVASCTFTASDLSGLNTGSALAQIAAYRSTGEVIDGKQVYFVKQTLRTRSVTVQ